MDTSLHNKQYRNLVIMIVTSFVFMYVLMYAMVNRIGNVIPNFNQFYMAGLMTAPMIILELALMGMMYPNKRLNKLIIVASAIAVILFWILIRQQVGISDKQFLKSMIPHHAGAILMCEKALITDPEIKKLCDGIKTSQQSEIEQMKNILHRLGNSDQ